MASDVPDEAQLRLSLTPPAPQRRWTVLLRAILAIPHLFWFGLLSYVAYAAVGIAWLAAIFIGRMPTGIRDFVGRIFQYGTRLYSYLFLLTDRYPGFAIGSEGDYPVELLLPPATRLNRAAVLFRLVLVAPAAVVATVVGVGMGPILLVAWVILLATGRLPGALFEVFATTLRYMVRLYSYLALLTPVYPSGLYGDRERTVTPDPWATLPEAPAAPVAEVGDPVDLAPPSAGGRFTRLFLSKAGKRLITTAIVLGSVLYVGSVVGSVAFAPDDASGEVTAAHDRLAEATEDYQLAVQGCAIEGGADCVHEANLELATAFDTFRDDLREVELPDGAVGTAHDVEEDAARLADLLRRMARTDDAAGYQSLAQEFSVLAGSFDEHYSELEFLVAF